MLHKNIQEISSFMHILISDDITEKSTSVLRTKFNHVMSRSSTIKKVYRQSGKTWNFWIRKSLDVAQKYFGDLLFYAYSHFRQYCREKNCCWNLPLLVSTHLLPLKRGNLRIIFVLHIKKSTSWRSYVFHAYKKV